MKMQMISTLQKELRVFEARQQERAPSNDGASAALTDQHMKEISKRMKEKVVAPIHVHILNNSIPQM